MTFIPGETFIPASGQVVGTKEKEYMHTAVDNGWLTAGMFNSQFEHMLGEYLGGRMPPASPVRTTNSGSSANLLAFSALTSPTLGSRAIKPGDEVITVACGFPTTINPILQNGCVPVFVDINSTLNINTKALEAAITPKTRAIMIAHTLGNPFNLEEVCALADRHDLWLIEDCCDALGATWRGQKVGTFGHLATLSFFPAHHITMGEGGAVIINDSTLLRAVESFRDWGRDCWCAPGKDNTCGRRFDQQHGQLPCGYDHKYTFSHAGYNLKITEMQAACGVAQLEQVEHFVEARRRNYQHMQKGLEKHYLNLLTPTVYPDADPSWFGFPILLRGVDFDRDTFVRYLNDNKIGTRLLFAGNVTKQPYMEGRNYRVVGELTNTDDVMHNLLWVGVQPALTTEMLDYVIDKIDMFMGNF
jgi:CDP-6-deoxy-D-xylo-4-hexulose-3-dehydrase